MRYVLFLLRNTKQATREITRRAQRRTGIEWICEEVAKSQISRKTKSIKIQGTMTKLKRSESNEILNNSQIN
jgi:hypothetical protein